jgi:hypothetical protein
VVATVLVARSLWGMLLRGEWLVWSVAVLGGDKAEDAPFSVFACILATSTGGATDAVHAKLGRAVEEGEGGVELGAGLFVRSFVSSSCSFFNGPLPPPPSQVTGVRGAGNGMAVPKFQPQGVDDTRTSASRWPTTWPIASARGAKPWPGSR